MATHSSILALEIPWTEEPGGYSPCGLKTSDTTEHACTRTHICLYSVETWCPKFKKCSPSWTSLLG